MNKEQVLGILTSLAMSEKTPATTVEWAPVAGKEERRKVVVPLAVDGAVVSGLSLEIVGPRAFPDERPFLDMTANLRAAVAGQVWHLGRIEFDPSGIPPHHINKQQYSPAPQLVAGGHHHSFSDNVKFGVDRCSQQENLPVAYPETNGFVTFNDVLETVRVRFVIPDLWLEDPKWLQLLV